MPTLQDDNLFFIDSTTSVHVELFLWFAPTGIPRIQQDKKNYAACKKDSSMFSPKKLLLEKSTFSPETSSKALKIVLMLHKLSQLALQVKIVICKL